MTTVKRYLMLLAVVIAAANPASATEELQTVVDWKSFERSGRYASLWLLRSLPATVALGHGLYPHRSQRIQYVIDCTASAYALSNWVLTDGEDGAGQVVWADRSNSLGFITATPGTLELAVIHAACAMEPNRQVAEHELRYLPDSSPLSN